MSIRFFCQIFYGCKIYVHYSLYFYSTPKARKPFPSPPPLPKPLIVFPTKRLGRKKFPFTKFLLVSKVPRRYHRHGLVLDRLARPYENYNRLCLTINETSRWWK